MKLALFGYGGHAREVACQIDQEVTFFVDDEYANNIAKPISEFNPEEYLMMVAVADSHDRKAIVDRLPKETKYFTYIHPSVHIMDDNIEVGEGSFIGANSIKKNISKKLIAISSEERAIPRSGYKLFSKQKKEIGTISSGGMSPCLKKGIALAYVDIDFKNENEFLVGIRDKFFTFEKTKLPFYKQGTYLK